MTSSEKKPTPIEKAAEDLFHFAIEREDTKWLLARLPPEADVKPARVEYELQILKIISVGWSIAYFLETWPEKQALVEIFWQAVREFSQSLSTTTEMMTGQEMDYFQVLKERLDNYLKALRRHPDASNPEAVIGPEFARHCGNENDLFAAYTGGRMFSGVTGRVREYLDAANLQATANPPSPRP
ncbi:MAG: hypothetical protein PVJ53_11205 [Desulfobacterales bacterium]|jgi:hypothetical protein